MACSENSIKKCTFFNLQNKCLSLTIKKRKIKKILKEIFTELEYWLQFIKLCNIFKVLLNFTIKEFCEMFDFLCSFFYNVLFLQSSPHSKTNIPSPFWILRTDILFRSIVLGVIHLLQEGKEQTILIQNIFFFKDFVNPGWEVLNRFSFFLYPGFKPCLFSITKIPRYINKDLTRNKRG